MLLSLFIKGNKKVKKGYIDENDSFLKQKTQINPRRQNK